MKITIRGQVEAVNTSKDGLTMRLRVKDLEAENTPGFKAELSNKQQGMLNAPRYAPPTKTQPGLAQTTITGPLELLDGLNRGDQVSFTVEHFGITSPWYDSAERKWKDITDYFYTCTSRDIIKRGTYASEMKKEKEARA